MDINLKNYQYNFVYSQARHPAFVGGWSVGKTLMAILRSRIYSKGIPNNLGVIFRKTAKSLFDSTLRDFEKATKLKVNSQRNLEDPNGSVTMFRHIDEIGDINQQNINLGWFYIEQGDELETDKEFFMLFGRLRRQVTPSDEFLKLGLPLRSGWVIANAGDHWMRPLWKEGKLLEQARQMAIDNPDLIEGEEKFTELIEATTWDNQDILPKDFLASLKLMEKSKPELYKQFVLNDWSVTQDQRIIITGVMLDMLKGVQQNVLRSKRLVACDPATGGDECKIKVFENTKVLETLTLHYNDTMKIVGEVMVLMHKYKTNNYVGDSIGIGKGICDRLRELGKNVIEFNSSEEANDKEKFANIKAEAWWYLMEQIQARNVEHFEDEELRKQLTSVRYKIVNSNGKIQVEPKDDTKKRLGRSPDDADCYVYGIWGLKQIQEEDVNTDIIFHRKPVFSGAGGW